MSVSRILSVARLELGQLVRRPMLYVTLFMLAFITHGLSTGDVLLGTGAAFVGGKQAWITSEFSTAFALAMLVGTMYSFFVAMAAGAAVTRDEELGLSGLLAATPLKPREYITGKFLAIIGAGTLLLAVHLAIAVLVNHAVPNPAAAMIRGPFALGNYLRPAIVFALPALIFFAGVPFYIGTRFRRSTWAFLFPVASLFVMFPFLWNWAPTWLDPKLNRFLMFIDPTGFRWLNETWLKLDRGAEYYNTAAIGLDSGFVLSRLALVAVGLLFVEAALRHFARSARAVTSRDDLRRAVESSAGEPRAIATFDRSEPLPTMRSRAPGLVRGTFDVLALEFRTMIREPMMYGFLLFILFESIMMTLLQPGAFDTAVLVTSGQFAAMSFNTLSLLVCLSLMIYTVESLERESSCGLSALLNATPIRTMATLLGKAIANATFAVLVLMAHVVACAIAIGIQGQVAFELTPFALVWGLLLLPTFFSWTGYIIAVHSVTASRYTTYAIGLGTVGLTIYAYFSGSITWVTNWLLWRAVRWSDMGAFELNREALVLNRLMVLGLGLLLAVAANHLVRRREFDLHAFVGGLSPRAVMRGAVRFAPLAAIPLVAGSLLWVGVLHGYQGETRERETKDYWKQNLATWRDADNPSLESVDLDVELEPGDRAFSVTGRFVLVNLNDDPLERFAMTGGFNWRDLEWTLNGVDYEPEDRSHLFVFTPDQPLLPKSSLEIGFRYRGSWPDGLTKRGEAGMEFVLPSGVVLTSSLSSQFVPQVGFQESIGVTDDNAYDGREYLPSFHEEVVPPGLGTERPFATRIQVSAPEEYTVNSVGRLTSSEVTDGRRTVVWESDHGVRMYNIVAGRWHVRHGEETAIYYHPEHTYNLDRMIQVLDASKRYYEEWFYPYPWEDLRISEFPAMAHYGQAFPSNVVFSEGIGFLTRPDDDFDAVALVTAHEVAHMWWGHILTPGDAPGGAVIAEGMAHYSSMRLIDELDGPRARIGLSKRFEAFYVGRRIKDAERALIFVDGARKRDSTLWYNKGGWVFWMLNDLIGDEAMDEGLHAFIDDWKDGPDYPVLQDLVIALRPHAPDTDAYDEFVEQWIFDIVLPEYRIDQVAVEESTGAVVFTVTNDGTGRMPVEVSVSRGDRYSDDFEEVRETVTLGAGETAKLRVEVDFAAERIVVDPDARVLQFRRKSAIEEL